jgi:RNA polymerase sigma-70 factor (ECF subfamily)
VNEEENAAALGPDRIRDAVVTEIPHLRRYARALLRDATAADDLVQDCLERALGRLHLFQPGTNLRSWLFAVLHNLFISQRRAAARRRDEPMADPPSPAVPPVQPARLEARDMGNALALLPPEQRAVVLLIGLEDMSYREAADVLGVPIGTVMSRLSRGRERLRQLMEGQAADGAAEPVLRRVK